MPFPSPRSLAFMAFSAGSFVSLGCRSSRRSPSGFSASVAFRSPARARCFAARVALRFGVMSSVRLGGLLVVVPVAVHYRDVMIVHSRPIAPLGGLLGSAGLLAACRSAGAGSL